MQAVVSGLGLVVMLLCAWALSSHRSKLPWRVILGGLLLQFAFAALILKTEAGRGFFDLCGATFNALIGCVDAGSDFLFDFSAIESTATGGSDSQKGEQHRYHLLASVAFRVLPSIVFFSSLMSILYHVGFVQRVVAVMAWIMHRTLGTSGAESLSAAANIFVGQTEAPLVVRPYLAGMTLSELNAVMVGGFATIAGGVLAAYVKMGIDAGHLITASVISAPASLLIAKVMVPETEHPQTMGTTRVRVERTSQNVIQAAADGAIDGMKLAINVAAMLIAFLAIVAMINLVLGWISIQTKMAPVESPWRLEVILGWLFFPFAWLMGIPADECARAGQVLGIRTVANEFLAYDQLAQWSQSRAISPRATMILSYALCGFANFGSIGIQIGGIGSLAESRKADLAKLGFRAMIGGTLASFMTACVVAILVPDEELRRGLPNDLEPVGQQVLQANSPQAMVRRVRVDQPNFKVWAEFGQDLPTGATRRDSATADNDQGRKDEIPCRYRAGNRIAFGTDRQPEGLIFDVAPDEDGRSFLGIPRLGLNGSAHVEVGIGCVGALHRLPCGLDQRIIRNHEVCPRSRSCPPLAARNDPFLDQLREFARWVEAGRERPLHRLYRGLALSGLRMHGRDDLTSFDRVTDTRVDL